MRGREPHASLMSDDSAPIAREGDRSFLIPVVDRQRSSVVEHPIRNRAVVGSIPTAGSGGREVRAAIW